MTLSLGNNPYNRISWEDAEFPILCQTCLGDNPYLRMMKERYGSECNICQRPFCVFRWCPGKGMRYKSTIVCQTCSKMKNVCQTCLLDLEYGLPVQVRDAVLGQKHDIPKSSINREYYTQNMESALTEAGGSVSGLDLLGHTQAQNDQLKRLRRSEPYYKRNAPHICSFYLKGECKRGEECPYRHEKPSDPDDPLSQQNIRDRYYGTNDPVADKLMKKLNRLPKLVAPEDPNITTLYVGNVMDPVTEQHLRDHFYQFGEIRNVKVVHKQNCAFVEYTTRLAAELAAEQSFNKMPFHAATVELFVIDSSPFARSCLLSRAGDSKTWCGDRTSAPGAFSPEKSDGTNHSFDWTEKRVSEDGTVVRTDGLEWVVIEGIRLNVRWAKPQAKQNPGGTAGDPQKRLQPVPGLPGALPAPDTLLDLTLPDLQQNVQGRLAPASASGHGIYYPSQDPTRLGSGKHGSQY